MGQKVNPITWRLGVGRTWDSEWTTDFYQDNYSSLLHQDLYIKEYIQSLAKKYFLYISKCRIRRHNNMIKIILYTSVPVSLFKKNSTVKVKRDLLKIRSSIQDIKKRINIYNSVYVDYFDKWHKIKDLKPIENSSLQKQHLALNLFYHNEYIKIQKNNNEKPLLLSDKEDNDVSDVNAHIKKAHIINISNLYKKLDKKNKEYLSYKKELTKKYYLLKFKNKLKKKLYLLTGQNISVYLVRVTSFGNSSLLLGTYIAQALRTHKFKKNQKNSYKKILKQYQEQAMKNKNVSSIKIRVSGRMNGIDRAKHYILSVGNMNVNSIVCPVDYAFLTIKTKYGIIGIKVWIAKKKNYKQLIQS